MSEPKLISPMLDDFSMGEPISNHHGVRCCPAMRNHSDSKYIVKIISIPASQVQLQALLLTGAYQNEAEARDYFLELAQGVLAETDVLAKLSKLEGFLPFEDRQIVPMEDAVGYDVYLLSSYRRNLARYLRKTNITHLTAVNLGLDMCAALAVCRKAGFLYAGLKPENIFLCNDREFRIGDLGFLKLDALKFTSIPEHCISSYTAPEIVDAFSDVNPTIDVYSAGMILYQIYNGGELPFAGRASMDPLPAPAYADYELAEIILKACAPDPNDRWQDPLEMGQALVSYMQRNGVNDTPILTNPQPHEELIQEQVQEPETAEEIPNEAELPQEDLLSAEQICLEEFDIDLSEAEADDTENPDNAVDTQPETEVPEEEISDEEFLNLSFLDDLVSDDTAPDADMAAGFSYEDVSEDASSILSMADDLINHNEPDEDTQETPASKTAVAVTDDATRVITEPALRSEAAEETPAEEKEADDEEEWPEPAEDGDNAEPDDSRDDLKSARRKSAIRKSEQRISARKKSDKKLSRKWIALTIAVVALLALIVGGYLFYRDYYLRSVSGLSLEGSEDHLVVKVSANVDESLLTVLCVDTYGTTKTSDVTDGKATFTGLDPNTLYKVKIQVEGLHKLTGKIEDSYTTPVQTDILSFTAVTGTEPGTAILSFTVDGMDSTAWSVTYWAEGEEEKKEIFGGHMVNISGLTSGKTYTFRLDAGSNMYITGSDTLQYLAVDPVVAENLTITGCTADSLTVSWQTPEGAAVDSWSVRCYSETGYAVSVVTEETEFTFSGLNGNEAHTVEVIANGMSTGNRCYMTANAVTVSNIKVVKKDASNLAVTWEYTGNKPSCQWILTYNVDGAAHSEMVRTNTSSATISPLVPGATYTISILLDDGTTVFTEPFSYTAPEAARFSGYLTGADYITASMCKTPEKAGWDRNDLTMDSYTNTFKVGTKGSFLLHTSRNYNTSSNVITTMYVIHAEDGTLVSSNITQQTWTNMWYKRYCELDIPALPDKAGNYTISIYFNGAFVHSQGFTMTDK